MANSTGRQEEKLSFGWLEAPIAGHCNLRCRSCSHHSPYLVPHLYDLAQFTADVRALSEVSEFSALMLVGGEPLLNPRIDDFLLAGIDSGVARMYGVITNGLLLHKMTDRFFELVDYIIVSAYPVTSPKRQAVEELLVARSRQFDFKYEIQETEYFYNIETPKLPDADAQKSFDGCRRRLVSPMIHSGVFYKCMRPPTTREYLVSRGANEALPDFARTDGVSIDSVNLLEALRDYMGSERALQSCSYCLKGFEDSYTPTAYTRFKSKLRDIQPLRKLIYGSPVAVKLCHTLNAKLLTPNVSATNRVQLHKHEILSKQECEPK